MNTAASVGAMLFAAWGGRPHRPTKDLDLLGFGDPGQPDVARRIAEVATAKSARRCQLMSEALFSKHWDEFFIYPTAR